VFSGEYWNACPIKRMHVPKVKKPRSEVCEEKEFSFKISL
jgi:hypothetical protein